jgi:hypothetical protein
MKMTFDKALPGILGEVCTGVLAFFLMIVRWKRAGRTIDHKIVMVSAGISGAILILGVVLIFVF